MDKLSARIFRLDSDLQITLYDDLSHTVLARLEVLETEQEKRSMERKLRKFC